NRYLTNLEILKEVQLGDIAPFIVCIGTNYADALSASAAGRPILLVNGVKLTAEQKAYLQGRHPHRIWVIGEFTTVGADVVSELTQYAPVEMVGSGNSYSRSLAIARYFFQGSQPRISIASGGNFADGLCGGPLAVLKNTPLLLTDNSVAGNRRIAAYAVDVQAYQLTIFGGPGSVPEATAKAVLSLN
nr:cell wall-binding repeat-containing protein [Clostridia bacterium]